MYLRRICALQLLLQLLQFPIVRCYKNHSALSAVIFTNIDPPDDNVHSEYYFGNCALSTKKNLIHRRIWTYEQLKGQMIIRAGLPRDPVFLPTDTCVYIRTKSTYADLVRYHAYKFNICICKLNYNYGGEIFDYFYYEWYIPVEMYKNIDWEIFIYITASYDNAVLLLDEVYQERRQMKSTHLLQICTIVFSFITSSFSWQFFTSLKDFTLSNSIKDPYVMHSEYRYGACRDRRKLKLYAHQYINHIELLGKVIARGWLNIQKIPTCIILRAISHEEDTFRSTTFNFQICVPRITYCHSQKRFKYYYYEWYIPSDYIGGMNWQIYFYGSESLFW